MRKNDELGMEKVCFILSQGVQKRGISFTLPDHSKLEKITFFKPLITCTKGKTFFILINFTNFASFKVY
jgi:hypothetical protein